MASKAGVMRCTTWLQYEMVQLDEWTVKYSSMSCFGCHKIKDWTSSEKVFVCAYRANTAYCANIVTMYRTSHEKLFAFDCPLLSQSELIMLTLRVFLRSKCVYMHSFNNDEGL